MKIRIIAVEKATFFKTTEHLLKQFCLVFGDMIPFLSFFFMVSIPTETEIANICDFFVWVEKAYVFVLLQVLPITKKSQERLKVLKKWNFSHSETQKQSRSITAMAMTPAVTTLALAGPNAKNPGDWPCQFCKKVNFARDSPFECHLSQFSGSYPISRSILQLYVPFSGTSALCSLFWIMARPGKVCWFEVNRGDITCQACGARRPISGTYGTPLPAPEENPLQSPTGRDFFFGGGNLGYVENNDAQCAHGFWFIFWHSWFHNFFTNFTAVSVDDFVSMTAWIWWFISATQRQWRKKKHDMQEIHETCVSKTLDDKKHQRNKSNTK